MNSLELMIDVRVH